jgi:hypothetical protein
MPMRFIANIPASFRKDNLQWLVVEYAVQGDGFLLLGYEDLKQDRILEFSYDKIDLAFERAHQFGVQHHDWMRYS